jgi:DNA-binding NarL/FixJ family response regulator
MAPGDTLASMTAPRRVAIGEDDVLLREGIAGVLKLGGFEVVAGAGDADDLLRKALAHRPDLIVADINMPPGHGDDGLVAAIEVRRRLPETAVLVLSQYYEERYAAELLADGAKIADLTPRELDVLAAMAEGKSNRGIAEALVVTPAAVEKHINRIFGKLGIDAVQTEHRRVHAVLMYLRET